MGRQAAQGARRESAMPLRYGRRFNSRRARTPALKRRAHDDYDTYFQACSPILHTKMTGALMTMRRRRERAAAARRSIFRVSHAGYHGPRVSSEISLSPPTRLATAAYEVPRRLAARGAASKLTRWLYYGCYIGAR